MIDFAGLVGRFTGKGAPDGAQAGTSPAAGTDGGIATGGQFAALVSLAAQLGADQDQTKLRLVVDNGPIEAGAGMDATAIAGDGATPVTLIDPATSSRIAAWTGVTRDRVATPRPVEGEIAAQEAGAAVEGEGAQALSDAQASDEESGDSAKDAPAAEDGQADPTPVTANPAPTPIVALPATQAQAAPDAIPASETAKVATVTKGQPESAAPIAGSAGEPRLKMGDQPLPKAIEALSAVPVPEVGASIASARPTESGADAAPEPQRAPNATTPQTPPSRTTSVAERAADAVPAPAEAVHGAAPQPAREQAALPMAIAAAPASTSTSGSASTPVRSRVAPRNAVADDAVSPAVATAAAARGDESVRPPASATTRSSDRSFAIANDAGPANAPLRAIVEALPPILQSELSASAVRGTTGPSTGQALGDQVIDMGVSGQWIDRMAREIAGLADGTGHSRFTLNPPHLGRLQVDLWREQGATNVRLMTETDEAAQRLSDGRQALQGDARVAALSLGTITVEKSSASFDTNRDQPRQGGESAGQAQQQAGGGQAQGRAGSGSQGSQGQTSDWVRRIARDDANQPSDASARAPAGRAANGRVRFA